MVLFVEECLGELEHVKSQLVIRKQAYPLHGVLSHFLVRVLRVEQLNCIFWLHGCPVAEHVVDFIDLNGSVPLDALEEDGEAFWVSLVVFTTLE